MNILQHNNLSQFLACFPKIRKEINEWRLVSVILADGAQTNIVSVTKGLWDHFKSAEGDILICNSRELLALIRTGKDESLETLQHKIQGRFPGGDIAASVTETTKEGLQKIAVRLQGAKPSSSVPVTSLLLEERRRRRENVIMVVDDDMFMRSLVVKAMEPHGRVVALEDGSKVVDAYLNALPDILFLDIHLPVRSGTEILEEILLFDQDAHVVMLSADSAKDNVLSTRNSGAKSFIAKPFTREKLEDALWKSPTARKNAK